MLHEVVCIETVSNLAVYCARASEIDITAFARVAQERGVTLYWPRFDGRAGRYDLAAAKVGAGELAPGRFGICEPAANAVTIPDPVRIENLVWLVPALAFDRDGHRLGHGGGYFDRLLADSRGLRVGIAYDWQIIDHVPAESHDERMDQLVTCSKSIQCNRNRIAACST